MREKMVALIRQIVIPFWAGEIADHLISNDVIPVVRCRDCKHFTEGMAIGMCKRDPLKPVMPMPYDNYCGFGERKDGADVQNT